MAHSFASFPARSAASRRRYRRKLRDDGARILQLIRKSCIETSMTRNRLLAHRDVWKEACPKVTSTRSLSSVCAEVEAPVIDNVDAKEEFVPVCVVTIAPEAQIFYQDAGSRDWYSYQVDCEPMIFDTECEEASSVHTPVTSLVQAAQISAAGNRGQQAFMSDFVPNVRCTPAHTGFEQLPDERADSAYDVFQEGDVCTTRTCRKLEFEVQKLNDKLRAIEARFNEPLATKTDAEDHFRPVPFSDIDFGRETLILFWEDDGKLDYDQNIINEATKLDAILQPARYKRLSPYDQRDAQCLDEKLIAAIIDDYVDIVVNRNMAEYEVEDEQDLRETEVRTKSFSINVMDSVINTFSYEITI